MMGRVALLVTFKKAKPKSQSLSRSHIRNIFIKSNQMKKLIFLFAIALVSCDAFYSSEHFIVVNNWSSHPIFFEASYRSNDTVIYIEVDETEVDYRWPDSHVIPEDFHSEYDFNSFLYTGKT